MAVQYRWDDFLLDLDAYRLERDGRPLSLEPKAFNMLALMVQRPGHLFSKQEIFDAVWPLTSVTDHALTRVVAQLRRVLGDEAGKAKYLETVPTRGYRWIRPVENVSHVPVPSSPPLQPENGAPLVDVPAIGKPHSSTSRLAIAATLVLGVAILALVFAAQRYSAAVSDKSAGGALADEGQHRVEWPVQITTHAGLDMQPVVSPQGDAVAFASDRTGAFELYVRALGDAATESPLTSDGGENVQPAWSPDGRSLAYHSRRRGGIWVIPARGGTSKQVVATGSSPRWSRDSQRIVFQSDEQQDVAPNGFGAQIGSTIRIADADGQRARALTETGNPIGGHAWPALSPDGRFLAFTVFEGGRENGIWILNLDSRKATVFARGSGLFESVFAPDGSALYIAGGEAFIVRIPFDPLTGTASGPREMIPVPGVPGVRGVTMTPDGRRISFAGIALNSQIWAQPIGPDGSPDGASIALTQDTSRRNSLPAISPDGSKVAYMSTRRGAPPNVWVMDIDGRHALQLTPDATFDFHPSWFPDGRRVGYFSNRGATEGLWAVDINTRREELLVDVTRYKERPEAAQLVGKLSELALSPSKSRVAFSLIAPPAGHRVMYVTDIDPFRPSALSDGARSIGYPAWSPDERSIAVEIKEGTDTHAGVIDVRTGVLRQVTSDRGQTWVRSWSPDSRKIAVAKLSGGAWSLQWLEIDSGRTGVIVPPGPPAVYVRYPDWSPRGTSVLFEHAEMRGNIWQLALR